MQTSMEKSYTMEERDDIANNGVSAMDYGDKTPPRNVATLDVLENFQEYHPAEGMNNKVAATPTSGYHTAESETAPTIGGINAATNERLSQCKRTAGGIDSENPPTKRSIDSYSSRASESYKNLANEDEPQRRLAYYDYTISAEREDSCSNMESEIKLILQEKLEEVTGKIACGVLSSLPYAQIGSVVSEPSDTSRKLKPDVSKEIKQICNLAHKAAVQGMAVDIIRSVKGRKLGVSERRADIIFEDSRLTGTDVEDSRIFDHSFDWKFIPTPEDLWLISPAFPVSIPLVMNVPSNTGSLAQSHPISDHSWLQR
ncbi:hypothetical protein SCUP234_11634 [Seiridium cupressi]